MDNQQNRSEQDSSLQAPGEANREKHINFLEKEEMGVERDDADNAGNASFTPMYLNSDTSLQTPEEKQHDEKVDPGKSTSVEASEDDLNETTFDRMRDEERTNVG